MSKARADETVTVRLPLGTADKIRAATGQPFSRLVRYVMLALLEKHEQTAAISPKTQAVNDIRSIVNEDERL